MNTDEEIAFIIEVGKKIQSRRKELKLSQETLSFDADIPRNQIGRIERGEINTSFITLFKISKALNTDILELLK